MIHFLPETFDPAAASPYTDAVARVASLRSALLVAEEVSGLDPIRAGETGVPAAWPEASTARQRCFDRRSLEAVQAAAAGLEMLVAQRVAGSEPHPKSAERLALVLRSELADLDRLFSL